MAEGRKARLPFLQPADANEGCSCECEHTHTDTVRTHLDFQCPSSMLQDNLVVEPPTSFFPNGTDVFNLPLPGISLLHACQDPGAEPTQVRDNPIINAHEVLNVVQF